MKIGMYSLLSVIHDEKRITQTLDNFIKEITHDINIEKIDKETLLSEKKEEYDLIVVFIKTGGTENLFKEIYEEFKKPVILIASALHNSLAASMEILSWVKSQGDKGKILHGQPDDIVDSLKTIIKIEETKEKIKNSRLGLIGRPSDWLIDSHIDKNMVEEKWGLKVIDIPIEEVIENFKIINDEQVIELTDKFTQKALSTEEPSQYDIIQAAKVYIVLKNIVEKYSLNSLTIRCFDLVTELKTTGCLALSLLNNEGIIAGCEGDIPATISMMIAYYLTGRLPFMANPVSLNIHQNKVKFAHCTIATEAVENYIIRSHFESGIGVGVQGELKKGGLTLFKIGGSKLQHVVYKNADLINNLNSEFACRTQILVDFNDNDIDYFLNNPIGNHHILLEEKYQDLFEEFFKRLEFDTKKHW